MRAVRAVALNPVVAQTDFVPGEYMVRVSLLPSCPSPAGADESVLPARGWCRIDTKLADTMREVALVGVRAIQPATLQPVAAQLGLELAVAGLLPHAQLMYTVREIAVTENDTEALAEGAHVSGISHTANSALHLTFHEGSSHRTVPSGDIAWS